MKTQAGSFQYNQNTIGNGRVQIIIRNCNCRYNTHKRNNFEHCIYFDEKNDVLTGKKEHLWQ